MTKVSLFLTQFRTQPVNLPGSTLHRGHDKGEFIPIQFRTQPVNLPGSTLHRGHDKGEFIPTQFRTQPVNLPGSTLHRGHDKESSSTPVTSHVKKRSQTLSAIQRESAYIRKLEVMSQVSPNQRKQNMCTDCKVEDDPDALHVALHYTHRHD
ncbi:uncharacterized protein [Amphiura filiformis]|uniref:uncharacterized protein n=1 Tax=Amphiura filiformis TaxID=82378 RepID=UPI003B2154DB